MFGSKAGDGARFKHETLNRRLCAPLLSSGSPALNEKGTGGKDCQERKGGDMHRGARNCIKVPETPAVICRRVIFLSRDQP